MDSWIRLQRAKYLAYSSLLVLLFAPSIINGLFSNKWFIWRMDKQYTRTWISLKGLKLQFRYAVIDLVFRENTAIKPASMVLLILLGQWRTIHYSFPQYQTTMLLAGTARCCVQTFIALNFVVFFSLAYSNYYVNCLLPRTVREHIERR